jgi:hypothetical protein
VSEGRKAGFMSQYQPYLNFDRALVDFSTIIAYGGHYLSKRCQQIERKKYEDRQQLLEQEEQNNSFVNLREEGDKNTEGTGAAPHAQKVG